MYKINSCIIPAAGNSSRFNHKESKIFYKFQNKAIIAYIVDKVKKYSKEIILIIKKKDKNKLQKIFKNKKIKFVFQSKADGIASAVYLGLKEAKYDNSIILWADQVGLSEETIVKTLKFFYRKSYFMVMPQIKSKKPYTKIISKKNYLKKIYSSRDGYKMNLNKKCDCGLFVSKTGILKKNLQKLINKKKILNKKKEHDFLKALNILAKKLKIKLINSYNSQDNIGINYFHDLKKMNTND